MTTILITGANGQLGNEFRDLAKATDQYKFVFHSKKSLDISDYNQLINLFESENIDFVVNCAAYTKVDEAEENEHLAVQINGLSVGNLGRICASLNKKLIHISTDYVFDGNQSHPYKETDQTNPITIYGQSKLRGEVLVRENLPSTMIIRTSWLYSSYGSNFVKTMLRLGNERETVNIVKDQVGSPTYARDLAKIILQLITTNHNYWGQLYHYCNDGIISWFDFSKAIMKTCQIGL